MVFPRRRTCLQAPSFERVHTLSVQAPVQPDRIVEVAREAEALGVDRLLLPDHPGSTASPFLLLGAVAAVTSTLGLGTYVLNAGIRHPALVAADVATLDVLSGGRAMIGVGAGHTPAEWALIGKPYPSAARRVDRLREFLDIMQRMLAPASEPVTHRGEHFTVEDALLESPRPIQRPVPLLLGGNGDRVLRLAGERADVVSLTGFGRTLGDGHSHEVMWREPDVAEKIEQVRAGAAARDKKPVIEVLVQHVAETTDRRTVAQRLADDIAGLDTATALDTPFLLTGTRAEIAEQMDSWQDRLGITSWVVRTPHMPLMAEIRAAYLR